MSNLASIYSQQGRTTEAEELEPQVLEAMKRVLSAEHPHTLTVMDNLAMTYGQQGRAKEAVLLHRVVESRKRVLSAEHPHTLMTVLFIDLCAPLD